MKPTVEHVVTQPRRAFPIAGGKLLVQQVPLHQDNLGWLIVEPQSGDCFAVDGPYADPYLETIESRGWRLRGVLNTHTHGDHIGVNRDLGARGLLDGLRVIGFHQHADQIPGLNEGVDEGDVIELFGARAEVWLTEGHLDGHITFVFEDAIFCGDTLFGGGCGYLFDGPPAKMARSLARLAALPADTQVCCAHEYTEDNLWFAWTVNPSNERLKTRIIETHALRREGASSVPSTIQQERDTNPFIRSAFDLEILNAVGLDENADDTARFAATRTLKDSRKYRNTPMPQDLLRQ